LETSKNFFPKIVSTHTWEERYETIKRIKKVGLSTCCGGIFGMGESDEDRVDLALTYSELEVDSIPLNFLMPIEGTPLEKAPGVEPLEALRIIAMFRFTNPKGGAQALRWEGTNPERLLRHGNADDQRHDGRGLL
jgi:biotin synthase